MTNTIRWVWPLLWAGVIFTLSCFVLTTGQTAKAVSTASAGAISPTGFLQVWHSMWWVVVKGAHTFEFGMLYALLRYAKRRPTWVALVVASVCGALDETHQFFVPHRGAKVSDVCIDILGVLTAWLICTWLDYRKSEISKEEIHPWIRPIVTNWWGGLAAAATYYLALYPLSIFAFGIMST